jgi:hypothetical protein
MSVPPPGANGTIILIGFSGNFILSAGPFAASWPPLAVTAMLSAQSAPNKVTNRFIALPSKKD